MEKYILPTLGSVRLRDLSPELLDDWQRRLLTEPTGHGILPPATIIKARTTLRLALVPAVVRSRIANRLDRILRPSLRSKPAQPLTPEKTRVLLAHVAAYCLGSSSRFVCTSACALAKRLLSAGKPWTWRLESSPCAERLPAGPVGRNHRPLPEPYGSRAMTASMTEAESMKRQEAGGLQDTQAYGRELRAPVAGGG